ncbi:uncharacterized protein [Musca autumnalis]|uniref:uncharacterized protein n=1 Tax=Musca autumnalis TaxID=221902 RepID=UPI003CF8818A
MSQVKHCRLCSSGCSVYYNLLDLNGCFNKKFDILQKYFDQKFLNAERRSNFTVLCLDCWQPICDFNNFKESLLLKGLEHDKNVTVRKEIPPVNVKMKSDENHPLNNLQESKTTAAIDKQSINAETKPSILSEQNLNLYDDSFDDFDIYSSDIKREPTGTQSISDLQKTKESIYIDKKSPENGNDQNNSTLPSDLDVSLEDYDMCFDLQKSTKAETASIIEDSNAICTVKTDPCAEEEAQLCNESLEDISLNDIKREQNTNPTSTDLKNLKTKETKTIHKSNKENIDVKTSSSPQLESSTKQLDESFENFDISFTELESIDIQFSSDDDDESLPDSVDTATSDTQDEINMRYDDKIADRLKDRNIWMKRHLDALKKQLENADDYEKPSLKREIEKLLFEYKERRRRLRRNNRRNRRLRRLQETKLHKRY